jgi:hypothetical protein
MQPRVNSSTSVCQRSGRPLYRCPPRSPSTTRRSDASHDTVRSRSKKSQGAAVSAVVASGLPACTSGAAAGGSLAIRSDEDGRSSSGSRTADEHARSPRPPRRALSRPRRRESRRATSNDAAPASNRSDAASCPAARGRCARPSFAARCSSGWWRRRSPTSRSVVRRTTTWERRKPNVLDLQLLRSPRLLAPHPAVLICANG